MGPESSRRARAVEIWAALRSLGSRGVEDLIERTCWHATVFADGLREAGFEVLNDVVLNQVLASFGDAEETERVIRRIQQAGTLQIWPYKSLHNRFPPNEIHNLARLCNTFQSSLFNRIPLSRWHALPRHLLLADTAQLYRLRADAGAVVEKYSSASGAYITEHKGQVDRATGSGYQAMFRRL